MCSRSANSRMDRPAWARAYLAKRPLVREHRILCGWEDLRFACLQVEVVGPGWLHFQEIAEEAPRASIPLAGSWSPLPSEATIENLQVRIQEQPEGVAMDDMIVWLADHRVASPGNLSQILAQLQGAGWLSLSKDGQITLTKAGTELREAALAAGFQSSIDEALGTMRAALEALECGQMILTQAARDAFGAVGLQLAESIDWMDAVEIPQEVEAAEAEASPSFLPDDLGYPPAIDPQQILPEDARQRRARSVRETQLQNYWGERWGWFSARERAALRLAEIIRAQQAEKRIAKFAEKSCFDVLFRWEIGLGSQESALSVEELLAITDR